MLAITSENFEKQVLQAKGVVVLDFWASWCGPCQMQAPAFEAAAKEHPEALFGKVNVDEESELAEQFQVMSIPTLVYLKDGKVLKRTVGYQEQAEISANIRELG